VKREIKGLIKDFKLDINDASFWERASEPGGGIIDMSIINLGMVYGSGFASNRSVSWIMGWVEGNLVGNDTNGCLNISVDIRYV